MRNYMYMYVIGIVQIPSGSTFIDFVGLPPKNWYPQQIMICGTCIKSLIVFLITRLPVHPIEPVTRWQCTKIGPKKYNDPTVIWKDFYAYALIFMWYDVRFDHFTWWLMHLHEKLYKVLSSHTCTFVIILLLLTGYIILLFLQLLWQKETKRNS